MYRIMQHLLSKQKFKHDKITLRAQMRERFFVWVIILKDLTKPLSLVGLNIVRVKTREQN